MAQDTNLPLPWMLASIAVRSAIVLVALSAGIRIFGKRDMGGLNLVDLLLVLLLGNAVQNAVTMGSGHLAVGLVSAGTLLVLNRLSGILFVRRPWLQRRFFGGPTILFNNGRLDQGLMQREGITKEDILAAAREMGLDHLAKVRLAILEDDGSISIVPKDEEEKQT